MKSIVLTAVSIVLVAGCARFDPGRSLLGSYRNYYETKGKIKEGRYFSPNANFSCAVPTLVQPGAVIRDKIERIEGGIIATVWFEDDFGQLYRISWYEITPDDFKKLDQFPIHRALLESILAYQLMLFREVSPGTTLELSETTGEGENANMFAVIHAPGASNIAVNGKRADSTRGFLIFIKKQWIYALSIQDTAPFDFKQETKRDRNQRLKTGLERFANTMEFN